MASIVPPLSVMVNGRWEPGIGDPTVLGWVTVAAYLAAALFAFRRALTVGTRTAGSERAGRLLLWWGLVALLLLLGINKQLDLQSWFTSVGRDLARSQGWYERRSGVQLAFIAGISAAALGGLAGSAWAIRRSWRRDGLAFTGAVFLVAFIVVRAASFHNIDRFLGFSPGGVRMNWILELGGIALILAGTVRAGRD